MNGGHYVCYISYITQEIGNCEICNSDSEDKPQCPYNHSVRNWFYISDSHYQSIDEQAVLKAEAYILFYRKIEQNN